MSAHCRTRSATLKASGVKVHFLLQAKERDRRDLMAAMREALDMHDDDVVGYAIVLWNWENASTALCRVRAGGIPTVLVPDFVRNRLLAERILIWAKQ